MEMFDIWPGVNLSRFLPSTVSKLLLVIARHRVKQSNIASDICCHTLYTVDATKFVTAQIDATFHEGRGKWRTVNSILQALMLGCLGQQSKDTFSFCHK